jgi:hypothetical protein
MVIRGTRIVPLWVTDGTSNRTCRPTAPKMLYQVVHSSPQNEYRLTWQVALHLTRFNLPSFVLGERGTWSTEAVTRWTCCALYALAANSLTRIA